MLTEITNSESAYNLDKDFNLEVNMNLFKKIEGTMGEASTKGHKAVDAGKKAAEQSTAYAEGKVVDVAKETADKGGEAVDATKKTVEKAVDATKKTVE
ncbi:MAG: hypothetical protein GY834_14785, partial [Bacteroidetes bacterium]|nr:hypothetical protein [Bacteroidota bacterium]